MPATAQAARPAWQRALPPRKPASSCSRAKPHWARIGTDRFFGRPRRLRRTHRHPQRRCAAGAGPPPLSDISLSLTHDRTQATAMALARPAVAAPSFGRAAAVPAAAAAPQGGARQPAARLRRHASTRPRSRAWRKRTMAIWAGCCGSSCGTRGCRARGELALVRVDNLDALLAAHAQGKGVLLLTGHFGNFEVATSAGLAQLSRSQGPLSLRAPADPPRVAGPAGDAALPQGRLRRAAQARRARRHPRPAVRRRPGGLPFRPACAAQGRGACRILRPPGRHLPQPGGDRRCPPARRWCRRRAGAKPTAAMCCASKPPSARSSTPTPTRPSA